MVGVEDKLVVLAVSVSPKMAFPAMETEPDKAAFRVENGAAGLAGDGKCVGVSTLRAAIRWKGSLFKTFKKIIQRSITILRVAHKWQG
jgi:hypothetical protein